MPATIYHVMPESVGDKKGAVTKAATANVYPDGSGAAGGDHDVHSTKDLHLVLGHDPTYAGHKIADLTLAEFMLLPGAQSVYGALDEASAFHAKTGKLYIPFFERKPGWGANDALPYQRLKDYADSIGQMFGLMTLRRYPYDNSAKAKAWEASAVLQMRAINSTGLTCGVLWHPTTGPGSIITDPADPLLLLMGWGKTIPNSQHLRTGVYRLPQNSASYDAALAHLTKVAYIPTPPEAPPVTTPPPVTQARIDIAKKFGLVNVDEAAVACRAAGLPFYAACALLEKESGGRNVYGHDKGAVLSGFPDEVSEANYRAFSWEAITRGLPSNGVGPCQITYAGGQRADGSRDGGYFRQMIAAGLKPWVPLDNMTFGFGLLLGHYNAHGHDWAAAGTAYNGASAYGKDLAAKVAAWRTRLGIKG